ncbi:3-phosphoshikimate 1-carboxyvinyltransferase [Alkalicoccobacillus murimartini]|uniref:3-phosphoshikimate 1-carboxyvinyltransferase n=1 Tax=Alkalicoccobacillus murimartini TaxID=171685 RepID=A0ABT9YIT5_9BACI|nr:3-phosphoshikimate 1-carboxyvinyltransferase [Alkalicoccobacillus murimartini]MDQ0207769.1 3-phosphoshikimate 1-carboxyvinyltransferase [Alkalicoccobacillus murimartini]
MHTPDSRARSDWSSLNDVKTVTLSPLQKTIHTDVRIPGSKSFTNRALIIAAMAEGPSTLSGILRSDDSFWCIDTLNKLGIETKVDGDTIKINGCNGNWPTKEADLYIGAAGTTARFLPGALAASHEGEWLVEASERMSQRPVELLLEGLRTLGASIESAGYYPLKIKGHGLKGGPVTISGKQSSQFISGLLIASPYAEQEVTVTIPDYIVQHAYVKITIDLMERFGVKVESNDELTTMVIPPSVYKGQELELEADASTASYFFALAALTNSRIKVTNLNMNTNQPDIYMVDIYEKMGCTVTRGDSFIEVIGTDQLKGGFDISMKEMSDQTLTLAALAPFASGPITLRDVEHIRHHESDRISAICKELTKLGIKVEEFADGLTVYPGTPSPAVLDSYDDHRVAMSLALIGLKVPGITVNDPGCVSKTCPTYFELLESMGVTVQYNKE